MYKSVRIQNFRGFEDLTVSGLTRVNLIVGENNVGKTALLEAISIIADAPRMQTPFRLERLRKSPVAGDKTTNIFEGLFHDFSLGHSIRLQAEAEDQTDTVSVFADDVKKTSISLGDGRDTALYVPDASEEPMRPPVVPLAGMASDVVRMELRKGTAGSPRTGTAFRMLDRGDGRRLGAMQFDEPSPNLPNEFLHVQAVAGLESDPTRLTNAILADKRELVVHAMQEVDRRIIGLEILETGAGSGIFVRLAASNRLMPLGLLGSGAVRLLSMVLASLAAEHGLLIVDEIDTGLHYSILPDVWRVMGASADELDYQLFATTHSYECMVAAHQAFADHPQDFSMHRLERRSDGSIVSKDFGHETLGLALEHRMEVR
ncbi:MAG: AAA family ATPase [Armatimonadota bacterium]